MSEQRRGSFGKKIWIGGGIAVAAAAIAVFSGVEVPPTGTDVSGTIAPAQRYRAEQPGTVDVKLGEQGGGSPSGVVSGVAAGDRAADRSDNRSDARSDNSCTRSVCLLGSCGRARSTVRLPRLVPRPATLGVARPPRELSGLF